MRNFAALSLIFFLCLVSLAGAEEASQSAAPSIDAQGVVSDSLKVDNNVQERRIPRVIASDTNSDGTPDRWEYYDNGMPVKVEADTNGDGNIDEWGIVEGGKITKVEKDSDYDGKVDRWVTY
ncbi:MAG: hypothetical protein HY593_04310 [Candidatus Omnitrophica bacterium]|nr:hypothetical protein [Candidatus Omnitrophota bacterium]